MRVHVASVYDLGIKRTVAVGRNVAKLKRAAVKEANENHPRIVIRDRHLVKQPYRQVDLCIESFDLL